MSFILTFLFGAHERDLLQPDTVIREDTPPKVFRKGQQAANNLRAESVMNAALNRSHSLRFSNLWLDIGVSHDSCWRWLRHPMAYDSRSKYSSQIVQVHLALWTPHHPKSQGKTSE